MRIRSCWQRARKNGNRSYTGICTIGNLIQPEIGDMIRRQAWDEFRVAVTSLEAADVSELIIDLPPESEAIVFRVLTKDRVEMVFSYLSIDQQEKLLRSLSSEQVCFIVEQLKPDDRVRLF